MYTDWQNSQNFLLPLSTAFLWRFENHNIEIYSIYIASVYYIKFDIDNIVGSIFDIVIFSLQITITKKV